jgi:hypothetical protein
VSPPPYGRRYTPLNPLIGPTPRQSKADAEKIPTLPPDSSGIYVHDQTNPGLIESIFHEALAAQRIAFERALAEHLGASKPSPLGLLSLGVSLLLLVGMAYVYRDLRSMMREDAAPMAPVIAPVAKRIEQTETRFDAIDERIGRLEAGVVRVLELLEPQADVRKRVR